MIKDAWKRFDTPLQLRPDLDRDALAANPATYGMVLTVTRDEVTSERLRKVLDAWQQRGPTPPRAEEEPTP
jgi:hypothetical protein